MRFVIIGVISTKVEAFGFSELTVTGQDARGEGYPGVGTKPTGYVGLTERLDHDPPFSNLMRDFASLSSLSSGHPRPRLGRRLARPDRPLVVNRRRPQDNERRSPSPGVTEYSRNPKKGIVAMECWQASRPLREGGGMMMVKAIFDHVHQLLL